MSEKRIVGRTKLADSAVGLVLRNPEQNRAELLGKIFAGIEAIKKDVGGDFEVQPSVLNRQILMRPVGEGSVELWIEYTFNIVSFRGINCSQAIYAKGRRRCAAGASEAHF